MKLIYTLSFTHLDSIAWIGGFSSAPDTKKPEELAPSPAKTAKKIKLPYISSGNQDGLIFISQVLHRYLKQNNIPHIWQVDTSSHSMIVWSNDLYQFSQLIF